MPRLDRLKFHPSKPGSCNHHPKEERAEVISRLLSTFVTHKLQEHLNFFIHFLNFSELFQTFSYLFDNYDVTSLETVIQSHFEIMRSVNKKSTCSFKSL